MFASHQYHHHPPHSLPIKTGAVVYNVMSFGPSQNPFLLDGVYCNGGESSLLSCSNSGYHRCHKGQESGVKCQSRWSYCARLVYVTVSDHVTDGM